MVAHWKHIEKSRRETISRMLSHGDRLKEIARNLGMHPTALSREAMDVRTPFAPPPPLRFSLAILAVLAHYHTRTRNAGMQEIENFLFRRREGPGGHDLSSRTM